MIPHAAGQPARKDSTALRALPVAEQGRAGEVSGRPTADSSRLTAGGLRPGQGRSGIRPTASGMTIMRICHTATGRGILPTPLSSSVYALRPFDPSPVPRMLSQTMIQAAMQA
jgi:hypothetical protein